MEYRANHIVNSRVNHRPNLPEISNQQKTLERLKNHFYSFTELPSKPSNKAVNIGFTLPIYHKRFVVFLMNKWVGWKDLQLDKILEGTDQYADVFGKRGFTFAEFKLVISGRVKEDFFNRHRVFDYLFLLDQADRDFFTVSNTDDDDEVLAAYIAAISHSIKQEIPILEQFFFSTKIPINLSFETLHRHSYILAQSGNGKSELIKMQWYNIQKQTYKKRGKGMILIEPHGDLSMEVLQLVLNRGVAKKRVVYLDTSIRDTAKKIFNEDILGADYTFVLNPFDVERASDGEINFLTQELSSVFFEVLKSEATTQMEAVIEAAVETLLRKPNTSIADLKAMMDDAEGEELIRFGMTIPNKERSKMVGKLIEDSRLKSTKSGIYYRLQSLIGDSELQKILIGKSTVNLEKEMNGGKIIICNLKKGKMGKKSAPLLGKLLLGLIQGIVMKRQSLSKELRPETFCFVDEFQNYVTPSIHEIMSEARKYGLHMILANQVMGQKMDGDMKRIILGNTAVKIAGDNEPDSLELMAKSMGDLKPKYFDKLPKYNFFLYDKMNKKSGVHILQVPDALVKRKAPFYLPKKEVKELILYMVHESGYYRKVVTEPVSNTSPPQQKGSSDSTSYKPNFED